MAHSTVGRSCISISVVVSPGELRHSFVHSRAHVKIRTERVSQGLGYVISGVPSCLCAGAHKVPASAAQPGSRPGDPAAGVQQRNESQPVAVAMTKKPRVAWTAELHKLFVKAVTELGVDTAVPKAIMTVWHRCTSTDLLFPCFSQVHSSSLYRCMYISHDDAIATICWLFAGMKGAPHLLAKQLCHCILDAVDLCVCRWGYRA